MALTWIIEQNNAAGSPLKQSYRVRINFKSILCIENLMLIINNVIWRLMGHGDHYLIEHTFREANQVADRLVKFGMSLDTCSRIFSNAPLFLSAAVRADFGGTCFLRGSNLFVSLFGA